MCENRDGRSTTTNCDDGVSGTTFDRPGFNRLVQDATDHKINLVLTKDLSRLGRDYIEAGKYTDFIFPSLGCRFIALNDGVDTIRKNNEMLVILKNVHERPLCAGHQQQDQGGEAVHLQGREICGLLCATRLPEERGGQAHFGDRPGDGPGGAAHLRSAVAGKRFPKNRSDPQRRKSPLTPNLLLHGGGAGKSPGRDGVLERCDGENHPPQRGVSRPYGTEQDGYGLLQKPQAGQQAGERVDQGGEHP